MQVILVTIPIQNKYPLLDAVEWDDPFGVSSSSSQACDIEYESEAEQEMVMSSRAIVVGDSVVWEVDRRFCGST